MDGVQRGMLQKQSRPACRRAFSAKQCLDSISYGQQETNEHLGRGKRYNQLGFFEEKVAFVEDRLV